MDGNLRRVAPLPALERVPRRDRGEREGGSEVLGVDLLDAPDLVEHGRPRPHPARAGAPRRRCSRSRGERCRSRTRLRLPQLVLRGIDGRPVRLDRVLPVAKSREDVRGHVKGVGRVGRDARVSAGRAETLRGDRREVVAVDQVVRHAGVIRLLGEDRLQNGSGLQLVPVRLVVRVQRGVERERIEDRRLGVLRILPGDGFHHLFVRDGALRVRDLVGVLIERVIASI